jgi:hypothetical protein
MTSEVKWEVIGKGKFKLGVNGQIYSLEFVVAAIGEKFNKIIGDCIQMELSKCLKLLFAMSRL